MVLPAGYTDADAERRGHHESATSTRAPFEVDKGRIIHSAAFRRLQGKTQVLGAGERDFYRTRLTHSLEVAQLGRGICAEVEGEFRPDQDLVEAICLAHDIGHPPFGHSGEKFLQQRMSRNGGFGANPQNIRIVALLEPKHRDTGLDLTRATLDGLIKYPVLYDRQNHRVSSKFTYREDEPLLKWIKQGITCPALNPIEGEIADWADQMAYSVNDVEDSVRGGLFDLHAARMHRNRISETAVASARKELLKRDQSIDAVSHQIAPESVMQLCEIIEDCYMKPEALRLRKENLKAWTSTTIKKLKKGCRIVVRAPEEKNMRYRYGLHVEREAICYSALLKAVVRVLVFDHPRVRTLESKGHTILAALFRRLLLEPTLLPLDFQELLSSAQYGSKHRIIADFISGMTDQYAYSYYRRLFEPGAGSFYENV